MKRDWKANPPETVEEGFQLAEYLAQSACDSIASKGLGNPIIRRTEKSVVVSWDGEDIYEVEIEAIQ